MHTSGAKDSMTHNYRADIDGLRAIAVISVLLFHLDFQALGGGYLGVDMFLVISGFLITRIIRKEAAAGIFTLANFYERRTRRIFPSALATVILSLIGAALLFSPADLVHQANAMMSTLFFVSNIYFWQHIDYFTANLDVKPLLHMWSLSLEEQFYIFWPLLLVFLVKRNANVKRILTVTAAIFAVSLIAAAAYYNTDNNAVFYLLPFRMFEFLIGASVVWLIEKKPTNATSNEIITALGIALMISSVLMLRSTMPLHVVWGIIPCIGTAMVIFAGENTKCSALISNRLMSYIGRISYQLYLVHWPVYVFFVYVAARSLTGIDQFTIAAVSFLLAIPLYHFIDKPLRPVSDTKSFFRFATICAALSMIIAISALTIRLDNGWPWRIDAEIRKQMDNPDAARGMLYGGVGFEPREVQKLGDANAAPSFVMFGDSFAAQYAVGLDKLLKENGKSALAIYHHDCLIAPGVRPRKTGPVDVLCATQFTEVQKLLQGNHLPVLVAHSWHTYMDKLADNSMSAINFAASPQYYNFIIKKIDEIRRNIGLDRQLIIMGIAPGSGPLKKTLNCKLTPTILTKPCDASVSVPSIQLRDGLDFNAAAAEYARTHANVVFLNPREAVCDTLNCKVVEGNKHFYSDYNHFSVDGSIMAIERFKDTLLSLSDKAMPVGDDALGTNPADSNIIMVPIAPIPGSPMVMMPIIAPEPEDAKDK